MVLDNLLSILLLASSLFTIFNKSATYTALGYFSISTIAAILMTNNGLELFGMIEFLLGVSAAAIFLILINITQGFTNIDKSSKKQRPIKLIIILLIIAIKVILLFVINNSILKDAVITIKKASIDNFLDELFGVNIVIFITLAIMLLTIVFMLKNSTNQKVSND